MINLEWLVFDLGMVCVEIDPAGRKALCCQITGCEASVFDQIFEEEAEPLAVGHISSENFLESLRVKLKGNWKKEDLARAICSEIVRPVTGTIALLNELRGRVKLACLSNTIDLHWQYLLADFDFMRIFDERLASHELHARKPEKEIFRLAERRLGTTAGNILFVDDNADNVAAARSCGWRALQFSSAEKLRAELADFNLLHRR